MFANIIYHDNIDTLKKLDPKFDQEYVRYAHQAKAGLSVTTVTLCRGAQLMSLFCVGDVIDKKYRVDGICSEAGGIGCILHVTPRMKSAFQVVLKYAKIVTKNR